MWFTDGFFLPFVLGDGGELCMTHVHGSNISWWGPSHMADV